MGKRIALAATAATLLTLAGVAQTQEGDGQSPPLRGPDAFGDIADKTERSRALFTEAGKVIQHPRCVNCYTRVDTPRQGEDMTLHVPRVYRGPDSRGIPGLRCSTCHQATNVEHAQVPGHPKWHLAPVSMVWYQVPLAEICEQIKDEQRNGGMTLAELEHHMGHDSLVGWGWNPGPGREPVPGDQETFGALISAWVESGAHCPSG